jgi:RHS repeat-associated protein
VLHQLGGSTIDGATYTLDSAGNRTAKADALAAVTSNYTYDPLYELTQVTQTTNTTESYSYDPVGNRLSSLAVSAYANNSSNELTSTSAASYAYDANGSTTSKIVSGSTTQYTWDFENRLTSVTLPGTSGTVTFKYDPFGRRIYKLSPNATSIFAYDGDNLVETVNATGSEVAHYAQGLIIDQPLAMQRGTTTDYFEADGLGSITSFSTSAGALANTYTYDSFGNTTNSTGSVTNYFRYTAREFDSETGIYYYRSRYYDPSAGRFISEDPTRFDAGVNFYAYVKNNAPNFNDPSGNDPFQHWPLNGNLLPGFKRQDGVCTTGLLANTMNSRPCIKKCCKEHDDCYTMYNCNASSFFNGGFPGPCQICNLEVEACILTADKSTGGAGCRKCSK